MTWCYTPHISAISFVSGNLPDLPTGRTCWETRCSRFWEGSGPETVPNGVKRCRNVQAPLCAPENTRDQLQSWAQGSESNRSAAKDKFTATHAHHLGWGTCETCFGELGRLWKVAASMLSKDVWVLRGAAARNDPLRNHQSTVVHTIVCVQLPSCVARACCHVLWGTRPGDIPHTPQVVESPCRVHCHRCL